MPVPQRQNENDLPLGDRRPIPDPTSLTTAQLLREMSNLKDVVFTRLDGMDKAVNLLTTSAARSPTVNEVFLQHEERFKAIDQQFSERDIRTEQTARDSKVAVDAALSAQKEAAGAQNESNAMANGKMENTFTKQIDGINTLIQARDKSTEEKFEDMKDRLRSTDNRIQALESRSVGVESQKKSASDSIGMIVGIMGALIAAGALIIAGIALKH